MKNLLRIRPIKKRFIISLIISILVIVGIILYFRFFDNTISFSSLWTALTVLTTSAIIWVLINERKNYVHTFAWILVLIFLPLVGIFFYFAVGRNFRKNKLFSNKEIADRLEFKAINKFLDVNYQDYNFMIDSQSSKIMKLLYNNSKAFLSHNNNIELFPDGIKLFDKMLLDIKQAKHHIHLEYFGFANDETGKRFRDALIKKAQEGVEVRIIVDDVGSWKFRFMLGKIFKSYGVKVYYFNKVRIPFMNSRFNYRNHRKIIVIDGKISYLGGLNIGNKYASKDKYFGYWRDTHMRIQGGATLGLQTVFLTDLYFLSKEYLFKEEYFDNSYTSGDISMQVVTSGPDSDWESIMQSYFIAITGATRNIYITSPYLILNESLNIALITAALSGIDVRIIVPGKPDHLIVFWGSRSYYQDLIEAGVKIYEYSKGFIHAKVLSVDSKLVSIGTANMDIRSFNHNFEINGIIYDSIVSREIDNQFFKDIDDSRQITIEDINNISRFTKVKLGISRLFSPLL